MVILRTCRIAKTTSSTVTENRADGGHKHVQKCVKYVNAHKLSFKTIAIILLHTCSCRINDKKNLKQKGGGKKTLFNVSERQQLSVTS